MKTPKYATLLWNKKKKYPVETIHYDTRQVTLDEGTENPITVSADDVIFDFSDMSLDEMETFIMVLNLHPLRKRYKKVEVFNEDN